MRGNAINEWTEDMAPGSILGGRFNVMGKDALAMTGTTRFPGTGVASLSNPVVNGVTNFGNLLVNGAALSGTFARKLQLTIKNNIRARQALGVLGPASLALGPLDLEVPFEFHLADETYYNLFIANTPIPVSWTITDALGNARVITLPRCKIASARRPSGTKGQDLILSGTFQALKDPTTGKSIIIDRCGAAVTPWA
jgi:hypothetical protein